jgi:hypothetical protein
MDHHIDVRDEPVERAPAFTEDDVPILAPGTHPDMGPGWTLHYRHVSGEVRSFHIPATVARDATGAEVLARQHLNRNGGRGW